MAAGAVDGALVMEACMWRWSISGDHSAPRPLLNRRHFLLSLGASQPTPANRTGKKRPVIRNLCGVVRLRPTNTHHMNKKLALRVDADLVTENLVRSGTRVRRHSLTKGESEKASPELHIPGAANVARISVGLESGFSPIGAEHAIAHGV